VEEEEAAPLFLYKGGREGRGIPDVKGTLWRIGTPETEF
jgi:hypothetical protein